MSQLDLAQALAPLYLGYLRRLDEMASRLPPEELLLEQTTRIQHGALALGADGLPLVFDVADRSSQETFEVRGSTPDAPAAEGGKLGNLEVRLLAGNWEALPVACDFGSGPTDREVIALADLLRAWALVGAQGGFARLDPARPARWSGRLHSLRIATEKTVTTATFDLGTCPPAAVAVLVSALDGYARDAWPLKSVTIGGKPDDA